MYEPKYRPADGEPIEEVLPAAIYAAATPETRRRPNLALAGRSGFAKAPPAAPGMRLAAAGLSAGSAVALVAAVVLALLLLAIVLM